MELEFDDVCTTDATTWVVEALNCEVPYYRKALEAANIRNVAIGVHVSSRKIILQFDENKTSQEAGRVFEMILGKGGSLDRCISQRSVLDEFYAESWGLYPLKPHWKLEI